MSRPLRIEFPGAVYHVTARGDRREPIFEDDVDRTALLAVLAQALSRFDAQCLAYCLMGNHYHLVVHTRQANLSRLMRHINGVYTQDFNRRRIKVGHLFQGRFKAILVDRDAYLLNLCRYVERNPVATRLVQRPAQWFWSSCQAHLGLVPTPPWLDSAGLLGYVLECPIQSAEELCIAQVRYARLVDQSNDLRLWDTALRQQIYLGDEEFAERMRARARMQSVTSSEVPRAQRKPAKMHTLDYWLNHVEGRELALGVFGVTH